MIRRWLERQLGALACRRDDHLGEVVPGSRGRLLRCIRCGLELRAARSFLRQEGV